MWGAAKQTSSSYKQINHTRIENGDDINDFYAFGKCLGKGSFGTVLKVRSLTTNKEWAIKAINKEKAGSATVKLLEREVGIMKRVHHPNIIHLEEVYECSEKLFLVMEICELGGLDELVKKEGFLSEADTRCVMKQLSNAIAYLHDNDIVHRDLKLENILLCRQVKEDEPINIKLTDFGLSYVRGGSGSDYMMQQVCGTPVYMAPEVIDNLGYSHQCDIWSMGVIMFTLITGNPPFRGANEEKLYEAIRAAEIDFSHLQWQDYNPCARQLQEGMLKKDPAHRFTSKEVRNHSWLTGEQCQSGQVFNVLEMMKLYNLEQKKARMAERALSETDSRTEECIADQETEEIVFVEEDTSPKEDINANKIEPTSSPPPMCNSLSPRGIESLKPSAKVKAAISKSLSPRGSQSSSSSKANALLDKRSSIKGTSSSLQPKGSGTIKSSTTRPKGTKKR